MIAVDTNILVYAHDTAAELHAPATARLRAMARGRARWGIPIFCLGEFVRVVTHRRVFARPFTGAEACAAVRRLVAAPSLEVLQPGAGFVDAFLHTVEAAAVTGNLVFDALIAALCREHGVATLLTQDRDFHRFEGLCIASL